MTDTKIDAEEAGALLGANLARVFNERDAALRLAALDEIWADDAVMYEPDAALHGRQAISDTVSALHGQLPPGTNFHPLAAAIANHGAAMLRWEAISGIGERVATGTDLAFIDAGRIRSLYVFLDLPEG